MPAAADLLPLLGDVLPAGGRVFAPDPALAAAVASSGRAVAGGALGDQTGSCLDAVLLLGDELARAGDRAETVLADAVHAARPGGVVAATAPNALYARLTGVAADGGRGFTAAQLTHAFGQRGMDVVLCCTPGVSAGLAGRPWAGAADLELDRQPGLLDAGPRTLVAGRTAVSEEMRSRRFFESVARKLVAAAVICRDGDGRLLIVHDTYKGVWTVPGGVVDAGEDPQTAAAREAWEEAGTRVLVGDLLGVFTLQWPERLHLFYAARPVAPEPAPEPRHPHEIGAVRWAPVDEAVGLLGPTVQREVVRCLQRPGRTWPR